jgi:hypothetical protein
VEILIVGLVHKGESFVHCASKLGLVGAFASENGSSVSSLVSFRAVLDFFFFLCRGKFELLSSV